MTDCTITQAPSPSESEGYSLITITVTDQVLVPKGTAIDVAPTGMPCSFTLPDGTTLKPWLTYERNEDEDLSTDALHSLGVFPEMSEKAISNA